MCACTIRLKVMINIMRYFTVITPYTLDLVLTTGNIASDLFYYTGVGRYIIIVHTKNTYLQDKL